MKCPKCGKNNPTNASVCSHCNTALANNKANAVGINSEFNSSQSTEKVMTGWQILMRIGIMVAALMAIAWIFSLVYKP